MIRSNGLKPSFPDNRDRLYRKQGLQLAESVDLREWDSNIEHQGYLGSCAAHAVTSAYELMVKDQYPDYFTDLSRLFVYYNTRELENTLLEDSGVYQLRSSLSAIKKYGVCKEEVWPYNPVKLFVKPDDASYLEASKRVITEYTRLNTLSELLESITDHRPVVIGLEIFSSFEDVKGDGLVPMPGPSDMSLGGHAMTLVGYSQSRQTFTAKNSFGKKWGDNGYCYLPWEYVRLYVFEKWRFEINDQSSSSDQSSASISMSVVL